MTKYGDRIHTIRLNLGYNQKEFGSLLGISQSTLSAYETDKMQPNINTLVHIAKKTNVSMDWLCGREDIVGKYNTIADVLSSICEITEIDELKIDFTIHENSDNSYVEMTFDNNDTINPKNSDFCQGIKAIATNIKAFEGYAISLAAYEAEKERIIEQYKNVSITKRQHKELTYDERRMKQAEWIKQQITEDGNDVCMLGKTIGERIREVRLQAGYNQKEFCSILDISQSTLSSCETDKLQPTVSTLIKISKEFHVSMDWLCGTEEK